MSYSNISSCNFRSRYRIVIESILHTLPLVSCSLSATKGIKCLSSLSTSEDIICAWIIHSVILCLNSICLSLCLDSVDLGLIKRLYIWISVTCRIGLLSFFILFISSIISSTSYNLVSHQHSVFFSLLGHILLFSLIDTIVNHFSCCLSFVGLIWLLSAFDLWLSLLILNGRSYLLR